MTLNESIRAHRRERAMTQEQLAEAMNVSAAAVSKWENGQSVPDITVLTALADYFEVSLDALVGYRVSSHRREELVRQIRAFTRQKKYHEATDAAREALRRYPNHFDAVYESARMYGFNGMEHGSREALRTAVDLMERAMALMDQNTDPALRRESLWSYLGLWYASLDDREQAIRCYEAGNIAGVNDIAIANSHAALGRYEKALPPLTNGLVGSMTRLFNAGTGALRCLLALNNAEEALSLCEWLLNVLMGMDAAPGSYVLKMRTIVYGWMAVALQRLDRAEEARAAVGHAADCAVAFDAAPDYSLSSIRFYQGEEKALSDSMGETALDALRKVLSGDEAAPALAALLDAPRGVTP